MNKPLSKPILKLLSKPLQRLSKFFQRLLGRSDIIIDGSLYMRRWRIIYTRWFQLRIHNIMRSDQDRELHDHPFSFISLILRGGYQEHTPVQDMPGWTQVRWYGPGSILFRRAEALHRLELVKGSTWTFVIGGPLRRTWGFQTEKGWVPWHKFAAGRKERPNDS